LAAHAGENEFRCQHTALLLIETANYLSPRKVQLDAPPISIESLDLSITGETSEKLRHDQTEKERGGKKGKKGALRMVNGCQL
jgi:hypothetical protein